jgi:hypothetical protein
VRLAVRGHLEAVGSRPRRPGCSRSLGQTGRTRRRSVLGRGHGAIRSCQGRTRCLRLVRCLGACVGSERWGSTQPVTGSVRARLVNICAARCTNMQSENGRRP